MFADWGIAEVFLILGFVLFVEGVFYALIPARMQNALRVVATLEVGTIRLGGLLSAILGFLVIWLCLA